MRLSRCHSACKIERRLTVSAYAAGGEEAVKKIGGQTATLLLEHLIQQPMPILDKERERVRVGRGDDVGVANKEGQNQGAAVTAMRT